MVGFVREDGEGYGLFGVAINAEIVRSSQARGGQESGELGYQLRIAETASGDDHLVRHARKTANADGNGRRGECRRCGHEIFGSAAMAEQLRNERGAVLFPAGALRS